MEEFHLESEYPAVKFIRLGTGEDIIAELVEFKATDEHYYVLNNPMKIVYTAGLAPGMISVMLMNWIFPRISDSTEFVIYPQDIITMGNTTREMTQYYYEQLEKMTSLKISVGAKEIMERLPQKGKPTLEDFEEEENDYTEEEYTEEEMEEVRRMLEDIKSNKGNKRTLH